MKCLEISAALRKVFLLAAICSLMSVIGISQTVEKEISNSENVNETEELSNQETKPELKQLPADKLREYVSSMEKLSERNYLMKAGKFDVKFITPVFVAYKESETKKYKSKWTEKGRIKKMAGDNFYGWRKYRGDYSVAVSLEIIPEIKSTGGTKAAKALLSWWSFAAAGALKGRYVFKADFDRMELWREGRKIEPLFAERISQEVSESNWDNNEIEDTAHYGSYRYPASAFAPGAQLELKVWQQGKSKPKTARVKERVRAQIWSDFEFFDSAGR